MVECPRELPVRRAGGIEFSLLVVDLAGQYDFALLEAGDVGLQLGDVRACAQAGFAPCLPPEMLGQMVLQLLYPAGQPGGPGVGVGEVGLQGRNGDSRRRCMRPFRTV
ncbi:hypothetical protein [Streptomyces sp. NPDC003943]